MPSHSRHIVVVFKPLRVFLPQDKKVNIFTVLTNYVLDIVAILCCIDALIRSYLHLIYKYDSFFNPL